jgi:hypothetical protein
VDFPVYSLLEGFQETEVFPTCFHDDPHWNASGSNLAAELIVGHILKHIEEHLGKSALER